MQSSNHAAIDHPDMPSPQVVLRSKSDRRFIQEYEMSNDKVSRLAARDAEKEKAANIGAGKVLKSYSSIIDSALSEYSGMSKAAEKLRRSLAAQHDKVLRRARRLRRLRKSAVEAVPDFVKKANAELMRAGYVRQRLPPAPHMMGETDAITARRPNVDAESNDRAGTVARFARSTELSTDRLRNDRRATLPSRPSRADSARSVWKSIPPGADVHSLVESAVEKALAQQARQWAAAVYRPRSSAGRIQALSSSASTSAGPGGQGQWVNFLAQAQQDNNAVSSATVSPAATAAPALPAVTAYRVTFNSGSGSPDSAPEQPTAPIPEAARPAQRAAATPRPRRARTVRAVPITAAGEARAREPTTAAPNFRLSRGIRSPRKTAARLESLTTARPIKAAAPAPTFYTEEEAMERHLQEQINSIFGPDPASSALTSESQMPAPAKQPRGRVVSLAAAKAKREQPQAAAAKKASIGRSPPSPRPPP